MKTDTAIRSFLPESSARSSATFCKLVPRPSYCVLLAPWHLLCANLGQLQLWSSFLRALTTNLTSVFSMTCSFFYSRFSILSSGLSPVFLQPLLQPSSNYHRIPPFPPITFVISRVCDFFDSTLHHFLFLRSGKSPFLRIVSAFNCV